MKGTEIRDLDTDEIRARLEELQLEQFRLRFRAATAQLDNPMRVQHVRRDIARMKTILRERELSAEGTNR